MRAPARFAGRTPLDFARETDTQVAVEELRRYGGGVKMASRRGTDLAFRLNKSYIRLSSDTLGKEKRRLRTGPAFISPQPPRVETTTKLEPENDAAIVPEVALVIVATRKGVSEPGENEIKFRWPDRDGFAQRDVDSATNDEIPSIVAWIPAPYADAWVHADIVLQILVKIGVGSSEHRRYERLEMLRAVFQNRAYVIGKEIAAGLDSATSRARAVGDCGESKGPGE